MTCTSVLSGGLLTGWPTTGLLHSSAIAHFLDSRQDDGFRKVVSEEFNELWVVDLKGNARTSGERRRREGGNVFDDKIRVGVAIYFFVRCQGSAGFRVVHSAVDDYAKAFEKINYVRDKKLTSSDFSEIFPNSNGNWFNQSNTDFSTLVPLADRKTKLAKTAPAERSVFGLYSLGVITARDEWVYDFEAKDLGRKVQAFINEYEGSRALHSGKDVSDADLGTVIKWTRDLKRQLRSDIANTFDSRSVHQTLFRPFVNKALYFNQNLNEMQYQIPQIFPSNVELSNKVICFSGIASSKPFSVLATDKIYGHDTLEKTQCLPALPLHRGG